MKRFFIILFFAVFAGHDADAQLSGQFYTAQDGHVYFQAQNVAGYNFQVGITATSSDRTNSEIINVGQGFYLGPTTPWRWYWKKGDTITVTYPNGQSVYWVCPMTDQSYGNISFRGKRCNGSVGCDCPGFEPITDGKEWQKSYCRHCNHKKSSHK